MNDHRFRPVREKKQKHSWIETYGDRQLTATKEGKLAQVLKIWWTHCTARFLLVTKFELTSQALNSELQLTDFRDYHRTQVVIWCHDWKKFVHHILLRMRKWKEVNDKMVHLTAMLSRTWCRWLPTVYEAKSNDYHFTLLDHGGKQLTEQKPKKKMSSTVRTCDDNSTSTTRNWHLKSPTHNVYGKRYASGFYYVHSSCFRIQQYCVESDHYSSHWPPWGRAAELHEAFAIHGIHIQSYISIGG